jgi:filamentous hemagglutinin
MNKQAYRIVFNQARGCLMAVAETASGRGKGASGERPGTPGHQDASHGASHGTNPGKGPALAGLTLACKLACNAVLVGLPLFWCNAVQAQSVTTQIVADPSASATQRPTVLNSANGTVQVNIQTPSAAGVSRNSYSQFDVGSQGAILNNSRTDVSTQLGGWVQGNPWLATGTARVILNEVNSPSPSQLQGYVEVAGQRAQVVIANPAGIAVNGAGFINASGVTLTTGTPVMSGGSLESYRVQRGSVSIDGAGLDTRSADYTAILSRAVQVNAGIWAQQLQVVTGANEVTASSIAADSTPVAQRLDASGSTPAYALDVAALGGMYAGKINLIGTEAGLGVRNDGQLLASSGSLTLSADGTLTNRGLIDAPDTRVQAQTVDNVGTGRLYGDRVAVAATTLNNREETTDGVTTAATIAGRERVDIGVQDLVNREQALIYSGGDMAIGGALDANWQASASAASVNNNSATIEAAQALSIQAASIRNTNEHFTTEVQQISQTDVTEYQHQPGDVYSASDNSTRFAPGEVSLSGCDVLCLTSPAGTSDSFVRYDVTRTISESVVTETAPGKILAGQGISLVATSLLNDKSQIVAGGALDVTTDSLTNNVGEGTRTTVDAGTVTSYWRVRHKGADSTGSATGAYAPGPAVKTISLDSARFANNASDATTGNVPTSSLFTTHPDPGASYLVESDPRFTQYKNWLGSDYMLAQLQFDPATTQKRLGDGFYEQRLIREQVLALTGQRFLGDYRQDDAQYQALMDNGLTYAREWNLRPGVALSAEQAAALTSDMVWLVAKDVTLADGSTQSVLVPQVYLRVRPGDVNGDGALLAGQDVKLNLNGDAINSGTIAGRNLVLLNADNIRNLGGTISADQVALQASQDIDNLGGSVQAQSAAWLSAGRDLNLITTTQASTSQAGANRFTYQGVDRVAGLYVSGDAGVLLASAGRDINLVAAAIGNAGSGPTQLIADNNINLGTVSTSASQDIRFSGVHHLKQSNSQDVGTQINTTGTLNITAGQDLNTRAANVNAGGALNIAAGGDINLQAGQASQSLDAANQVKSSGFLNSRTLTTRETLSQTNALGSSLSGQTVNIQSGQDILVSGSSVVSDNGTSLAAAGNLNIEAAQETYQKDNYRQTTKSGLFSGGGLAVTIGTQQQSLDQQNTGTQSAASTIGAISGNVNLSAAQTYKQTGSDVLAPGGDINISAQDVQITEARETSQSRVEQKFKQSGLTLAITSPVISALQTVQQMSAAASQISDSRMQALAAASAALAGYGAYTAIDNGQGRTINGKDNQIYTGKTNPDGTPQTRDATTADKVGGINLSVSVGSSSSQSTQTSTSNTARGSTLTAGGNIHIQASGKNESSPADSNLLIRGSDINAAGNVSLQAEGDITLQAAANTSEEHSNNSSRSGSIGVSIGTNTGITASASRGKGQGNGVETTYSNTHVSGASVNIQSGADTTLQGAVVQGEQVSVNTGGNLTIQSLQDSASYQERSSSVGGSITVGAGFSGSINASKTKIDSDYLSVTEQSGIRAGDGGFQVAVAGDTTLTGGAITSSDAAVNGNLNRFSTGGSLATRDLQNSASYNASSASLGIGTTGGSAGIGSDKGSAASTTQAAISGIAGNQEARTGDAETGINAIFDKERVQQDINAQVQITQAFGQQASKAWGDYTDKRMREALARGDKEEAAKWAEGGIYRAAGHTVIGALGGGASGALGAGLSSTAAPLLNELQSQLQAGLEKAGLPKDVAKGLAGMASGATVAALGNAAGGSAGAMGAFNQDANNRQLHPTEAKLIQDNAKAYAKKRFGTASPTDEQISQAQAELTQQALRNIDSAHDVRLGADNTQAQAFLTELGAGQTQADSLTGQSYQLFTADAATRDNHAMFGQYAKTSPTVEGALDLAYSRVLYPKDGQTIAGLNGTGAGTLTGSDLAVMDAATDNRNMRQQPPVVQWAVLGELRQERRDNLQTQLQLTQELQTLNAQGDTSAQAAQRRGEIIFELTRLQFEDQTLLQATKQQILTMGSVGTLNQIDQRETYEGVGSSLALAGLSGKGVSASSLSARINALKGAIEEVQATAAAAKAEAQAVAKARVDNNASADSTYAGDVPVRPKDGPVTSGTTQTDTPIGKHLIEAEVKTYKGQPSEIAGGHNMDNFNQTLQANGGQVIGLPKEVAPGIYQVEYRLPGTRQGETKTKTVYDPAMYTDAQMATMANDAAARAIYQWNRGGGVTNVEFVMVNGVKFEVPISQYKGKPYIPTAFPSGR